MSKAPAKPSDWKTYDVYVTGFPPVAVSAPSRGKALVSAMESYSHVDEHITFGRFLKIAKAYVRKEEPRPDGYDYIRQAYGVDVAIGDVVKLENEGSWNGREGKVIYPGRSSAHVLLAMEGEASPIRVHPDNVRLVSRGTKLNLARAA